MSTLTLSRASTLAALALTLLSLGCGGFRLRSVQPQSSPPDTILGSGYLALVQVQLAPDLQPDKVNMLLNNDVPGEMQRALMGVGRGQIPFTAVVTITQFRNGWGPARMHTQTVIHDPAGNVIRSFENESLTMRGGNKTSRLIRIAQHNVQEIANSL